MIYKIFLLFKKTLKNKFSILKNITKNMIRKLIKFLTLPFVKLLTSSRLGRDIMYTSLPENYLIVGNTKEGLHYIVNSSDQVIGKSIFCEKISFDSEILEKSLELIGCKKSTLIDVGANIGTIGISGIHSKLFDKCISFEPEPRNFKLLQANVIINNLSDKFELRNEALSSECGLLLDFELSEDNYGDHRVRIISNSGLYKENKRETISVKSNTLDNVLKDYDLNEILLFMDTQGFEGHVLSGAKSLIEARVPIVTEFWPYGLKRTDGFEKFYNALIKSKYTTLYDLRFTDKKMDFTIDSIKSIAHDLRDNGDFTDLLFCD